MVKEIITNDITGTAILSQRSLKIEKGEDVRELVRDLIDTANAQDQDKCVGLAAIQIGAAKRVCIISVGEGKWMALVNPMIIGHSTGHHISTEGCLSVEGVREVKRWNQVTVIHQDNGKQKKLTFGGMHSVVVQHEIDHMNGILI